MLHNAANKNLRAFTEQLSAETLAYSDMERKFNAARLPVEQRIRRFAIHLAIIFFMDKKHRFFGGPGTQLKRRTTVIGSITRSYCGEGRAIRRPDVHGNILWSERGRAHEIRRAE